MPPTRKIFHFITSPFDILSRSEMDSLAQSHPEVFEGFHHDQKGGSALDPTLLKDSGLVVSISVLPPFFYFLEITIINYPQFAGLS